MTHFQRAGHWRTSVNGNLHWVSAHGVDRDGWGSWSGDFSTPAQSIHVAAPQGTGTRQSSCPECGAPVYFYWNENGSRVYFDALGPPWPKHPCMDVSSAGPRLRLGPVLGRYEMLIANARARLEALAPAPAMPGVFVVRAVVKVGSRRHVTLGEIGGDHLTVVISPPAPPEHALAVIQDTWLYWTEPESGKHGKCPVWKTFS